LTSLGRDGALRNELHILYLHLTTSRAGQPAYPLQKHDFPQPTYQSRFSAWYSAVVDSIRLCAAA